MKTKTFPFLIILFCSFSGLVAQSTDSTSLNQEVISKLETLTVSFSGNAQNCIPYDVYAFKYKRSWLIVMKESDNLALFVTKPPRSEEKLYVASDFLLDGLSKIIPNTTYYNRKNRRRVVNDIEIYPFYKLQRRGKQVMKGLLLLELPDEEEPSTFFLLKPFMKKKEEVLDKAPLKRDFEESIQKAKEKVGAEVSEVVE